MVYYEEQLDEPADEPVPISVRKLAAAAAAAASRKRCRHRCLLPLCSSVRLTHHAAGLATASVFLPPLSAAAASTADCIIIDHFSAFEFELVAPFLTLRVKTAGFEPKRPEI